MNMGQGDSFHVERITALGSQNRIERAAPFAASQNNRRRPNPAPEQEEADETDSQPVSESDAAPQDVIEWSAALREGFALTVVSSFHAPVPPASSPDSESRRLDLTV